MWVRNTPQFAEPFGTQAIGTAYESSLLQQVDSHPRKEQRREVAQQRNTGQL